MVNTELPNTKLKVPSKNKQECYLAQEYVLGWILSYDEFNNLWNSGAIQLVECKHCQNI